MKAKIIKHSKGLVGENHTFYRLELHVENEEDKKLLEELTTNFVVWVSPCHTKKDNKEYISYWGKK